MTARLHHLDNLRAAMVLCVLVLHAVLAYNSFAVWWYAADTSNQAGFEVICFLLDSFPLPILFFLAGCFAVPTLDRHGPQRFITGKLRRLGIPFVLVSFLALPLVSWITFTTRGIPVPGPLEFWATFALDAIVPQWTLVQGLPDYAAMGVSFSQFHLWFVSLLLVFFLLYVPLHGLLPQKSKSDSGPSVFARLGLGCLCMVLLMTLLSEFMHVWSWVNMGWLLFQPVRLPLYLGFFLLGALAWKRGWITNGTLPGPLWAWTLAALITVGCYFVITGSLLATPVPLTTGQNLLLATIRTGLSLAWLGLLLRLFARWGRWSGPAATSLAASSYAVYLLHLPVCVAAQWTLLSVALHPALKASMVLALSLFLPWTLHSAWRKDFSR